MAQAKVHPLRGRIGGLGPAAARGLRRTVLGQTAQARVRLHRVTAELTALTSRNRARAHRATATIGRRTQMAVAQMAVGAPMSRLRVRAAAGHPMHLPTPRPRVDTPRRVAVTLLLHTQHLRARTRRPAAVIRRPAVAMAAVAEEVTTVVVAEAGAGRTVTPAGGGRPPGGTSPGEDV